MQALAVGARHLGWRFVVIGDRKSPEIFSLEGADYYNLDRQAATGFEFAKFAPTGHYARKNVGYLASIEAGATSICETDDDNFPTEQFWKERSVIHSGPVVTDPEWVNIYAYYSSTGIWPRGLPLDEVRTHPPLLGGLAQQELECPIHQGLADVNPDVDAIYRLTLPLPLDFEERSLSVATLGSWCPFNSQNTRWWPSAYPLLYLPFHCSFRMTDIWRSFVVQRILHEGGKGVLFHEATVWQDRNEHDLMRDFADEVVGYLNNRTIRARLLDLAISGKTEDAGADLERCYEELIRMELVGVEERKLIHAWRRDIEKIYVRG